jgi:hypothetical protein
MAIDILHTKPRFAEEEDETHDFTIREGLSWRVKKLVDQLSTMARGFMFIGGENGGGKDLFAVSTAAIFKYYFGRRAILDFLPCETFGEYVLLDVSTILKIVEDIARSYKVQGIEKSADSKELAQWMQEAIVKWLLEGEGYDIFKGAVYYLSELKKVAYNRNPMSRTNKFIGTLGTCWRHLDLLVMGTHVYENEIDVKAYLQYAKLKTYCKSLQIVKDDLFQATVLRGQYSGPDFVISNVLMRPLKIYIEGNEPRDFLGGKRFYDLYKTKHMHF